MTTNTMSEEFAFNANQYFDFKHFNDDEKVDRYFEECQGIEPVTINDPKATFVESTEYLHDDNMVFYTPRAMEDSTATVYTKSKMRRSSSLSNFNFRSVEDDREADVETIHSSSSEQQEDKTNELRLSNNSEDLSKPTTNLVKMRPRGISRENLNKLAQPKQRFASSENLARSDYVCMAEAVSKFHRATPQRFRSQSAKSQLNLLGKVARPQLTKPSSPKLNTKTRARPVHVLTREERELMEFEEAKNFKIKAHNPSSRRTNGPLKPQVIERKANTIPEPFHLTESLKKVPKTPEKRYVFHAAPVPKSIYSPCKLKPVKSKESVVAESPAFMKKYRETHCAKEESGKKAPPVSPRPFKPRRTEIAPFSFEKRNDQLVRRREELIQKVLEEEKKAREFHANPVPKKILNSKHGSFESTLSSTSSQQKKTSSNNNVAPFKARPATVLKAKPFEPKKSEIGAIQVEEFNFYTEQRRAERLKFEQQVKEKEEAVNTYKEEMRLRQLAIEEEEEREFKKQAEFKAQPVRKFTPVNVQPSNKVTIPVSPKFCYTERNKNKENIAVNSVN